MTQPGLDEPPSPVRSLTFRLTTGDMQTLAARPRPLPRTTRLAIIGVWFVSCLAVGFMDDEIARLLPWAGKMRMFVAVGAVTALYYLLNAVAAQIETGARVRAARAPSTDTAIDTWQDHVDVRQDGTARTYTWDQLADIGLDDAGLTLFMTSGETLFIPQRAFADRQDMLAFNLLVDGILRPADEDDAE